MILSKQNDFLACAIYSLLAFALSSLLLQFSYFIGHDGVWYARIAENIIAGKGICVNIGEPYVDHPPLYPFLIGLINLLFRNLEFSAHFISMLAFSLAIFPLFHLTKDIYSANTAHWASILYVTNGFLLIHSNLVLAESLFVLLTLAQFYWVHKIIQDSTHPLKASALIGILSGAAYLARPEGLVFYIAGILAILVCTPGNLPYKKRGIALSGAIFLLFFIPHLHFIHKNTHKFQLSVAINEIFIKRQLDVSHPGRYLDVKKIYEGLTDDKTRLKLDELKENFKLTDYLTKDNYALLKSGFKSILWRWLELNKYLFCGFGFFFIGASFLGAPWNRKRKKSEFLLLLFLLTIIPQFFGIFHPKRYFLYFPIFLIWMGNGIETTKNWAGASFSLGRRSTIGVPIIVCLILALFSGGYLYRTIRDDPSAYEYKELGEWMKKNIPDISREYVAARHPSVIFYSGAKLLHPPYFPYVDNFDDFLNYMKHQGAKYFVIGEDLEPPASDSYRALLDETIPLPSGIFRRHVIRGKKKVSLFEISSQESST